MILDSHGVETLLGRPGGMTWDAALSQIKHSHIYLLMDCKSLKLHARTLTMAVPTITNYLSLSLDTILHRSDRYYLLPVVRHKC